MKAATVHLPIHLGCPVWACGDWAGQVYPEKTPRSAYLAWYSRTFNKLEGNSTYYALPPAASIERWAEQTARGFRFALKFPRLISHELELAAAGEATSEFLRGIESASQLRKPRTPLRQTVTGRHPMLRIVGRNRAELVDRFFDQWAPIVARWVADGLRPYIFTHAPDDAHAPALARRFARRLDQELPSDRLHVPSPPSKARQLSLLADE